ncbi:MAG: hypothetical protein F4069_09525 [Rhodothermaceae bacterium]|nr:hypothetical protein [Rhodothermaceae bacterium]MYG69282.1 hypothetical protein [Rhodothermaceae bacterium]MYJ45546.1 hypothetical protein [Rhodothermaceae bacterium]
MNRIWIIAIIGAVCFSLVVIGIRRAIRYKQVQHAAELAGLYTELAELHIEFAELYNEKAMWFSGAAEEEEEQYSEYIKSDNYDPSRGATMRELIADLNADSEKYTALAELATALAESITKPGSVTVPDFNAELYTELKYVGGDELYTKLAELYARMVELQTGL